MKNKWQLASTIVIPVLLSSNIILINQYKQDINKYEGKVHNQSKLIKQITNENKSLIDSVRSKGKELDVLQDQLNQVKQENEELNKRLDNIFSYEITAYSPYAESTGKSPGDKNYKVTASGERVKQNYTIACPPSLAFGTKLNIQNVGQRVCADRGGDIKEKRLDLYFDSVEAALNFGRKMLKVEVLGND
jgi:3D (Asp-Asp-Asp) domain-containing protein